jgi:hypothetical protein
MTIAQVCNRIDQLQNSLDILDKVHNIPAYITVTGISYLPNVNQFDTYCNDEEIPHWHSKIMFLFQMSNLPHSWILNICNQSSARYSTEPLFVQVYLISHHIKLYVKKTITSYLELHNHSCVQIQ